MFFPTVYLREILVFDWLREGQYITYCPVFNIALFFGVLQSILTNIVLYKQVSRGEIKFELRISPRRLGQYFKNIRLEKYLSYYPLTRLLKVLLFPECLSQALRTRKYSFFFAKMREYTENISQPRF